MVWNHEMLVSAQMNFYKSISAYYILKVHFYIVTRKTFFMTWTKIVVEFEHLSKITEWGGVNTHHTAWILKTCIFYIVIALIKVVEKSEPEP